MDTRTTMSSFIRAWRLSLALSILPAASPTVRPRRNRSITWSLHSLPDRSLLF